MKDVYLKAATREALLSRMQDDGLLANASVVPGVNLDEIGDIDGASGFRANLRLTVEARLESAESIEIAAPETPFRVWF